jgi:DMSO/TMAO reductase YedYZ molybdopterin-dependent catalytic subunit
LGDGLMLLFAVLVASIASIVAAFWSAAETERVSATETRWLALAFCVLGYGTAGGMGLLYVAVIFMVG